MSTRAARVGVIGLGYWGVNVARVLRELPGCELLWCCDLDGGRLARAEGRFPGPHFSADPEDLLADESLDAIAVATPVPTHAELAGRVLAAGLDCFVEKPLAGTVAEAERLAVAAADGDRVLMVGHLLEYHPAVAALRGLIDENRLGEVRYLYSQRLNLGKLRADENALWSLGAHDVSVALALTGELPSEVSARGESYMREGVEDVVFAFLRFPSGIVAHLHLSWLDPHKERRLTVVGSRRMASFDDMAPERKLTVFDKGFDPDAEGAEDYVVRSGQAQSPSLESGEPLHLELEHFLERVADRGAPRSDGASGVAVVRVLDALQTSLDAGGESVALGERAAS